MCLPFGGAGLRRERMSAPRASRPEQLRGFRQLVRALRFRNYRLFFSGQSVSLVGTWITRTATPWLVYDLSRSEVLLGVVGFAGQIPTFLLAPLAGVFVDRHNRHRILLVTQFLSMLQSLVLAALALTGAIAVWHIVALSIVQGLINAFDMPARQSFVIQMVENPQDLPNAIALNSSMFNGARLVGPALAGVLIAAVGTGICFLIDAVSYLAVIASLLAMNVLPRRGEGRHAEVWEELRDGVRYTFGFPPIRAILLLLTVFSLMGASYVVLMPVFATEVLQGDAHTLGFLMAAPGLGALCGALFLASRSSVRGLGRVMVWAGTLFGASLMAFSMSDTLWLSVHLLLMAGFGMMLQVASGNTIIQTITDEDKRGRVMGFYTMSLVGTAPFGSLLAGGMASTLGAPVTVLIGGGCCILGAAIFAKQLPAIRRLVRPIYVRKGIIAEVATAIQAATPSNR